MLLGYYDLLTICIYNQKCNMKKLPHVAALGCIIHTNFDQLMGLKSILI